MIHYIISLYLLATLALKSATALDTINTTYFDTLDSIDREYGYLTDKYTQSLINIRQYYTNQYIKLKIANITSKRIEFNGTNKAINPVKDPDLDLLYEKEGNELDILYKNTWYRLSSLNSYRISIINQIMQSKFNILQQRHYEHAIDEDDEDF